MEFRDKIMLLEHWPLKIFNEILYEHDKASLFLRNSERVL